ncbi:MAG TPA: radical SAM protein, partial [Candidatus Ozemobacteraceae bacterium]|nr:radical SAM protein [Candidatus Ozemobacteraceae bacterium]
TSPRSYIKNISSLPIPIFESTLQKYNYEGSATPEAFTWIMLSARGCPFQCTYCASDKIVRFRSPEHVLEEIRAVKMKYGITRFCFEDDSFTLHKERFHRLCEMLRAEKTTWICNTRVDLIDEPMIRLMKESGCVGIAIGIETGSPKTLAAISKKISFDMIHKAITLLKAYKILVSGYFMIGFPWETREDMKQTIALMSRSNLDYFHLSVVTPLPGTQLFRSLIASGKLNLDTIDWKNFHQGSPYMNFSDYSDAEWKKIISDLTYMAFRISRKKYFFATLRKFMLEPTAVIERIIVRLRNSVPMLKKFLFQ